MALLGTSSLMNEEKERQSVRDTAIEWLMRRHDDQSSRKEQDAFEAWLVANPANRIAYDEISQIYDRLTAIDFGVPSPRAGNRIVVTTLSFIVASLLVAFVFFEELSLFLRSDYYSSPGGIKLLTLEDGSRVQLDSRSAIALRYSSEERRLASWRDRRGSTWRRKRRGLSSSRPPTARRRRSAPLSASTWTRAV